MAGDPEKKPLKGILDGIKKGIDDLVTLDVATYTGELTLSQEATVQNVPLESVYKVMEKDVKVSGQLKLVALTHVAFDADTVNYVKEGLTDLEKPLIQTHEAMLKAASEARQAFIKAAAEIVGLSF